MFDWDEAAQWVWETSEGTRFTIKTIDGVLYYQYWEGTTDTFYRWGLLEGNEHLFKKYTKYKQLSPFFGPTIPAVIVKIRLMEERWKRFQEGKKKKKEVKTIPSKARDGSFNGWVYV
jgi:hypothetical protein